MRQEVFNGSNVYVSHPQRIIPDCVSITGDVVHIATRKKVKWATIKGYVGKLGGGYEIEVSIRLEDLGLRLGTPLSKISTQPGSVGYSEWLRICRSWGSL